MALDGSIRQSTKPNQIRQVNQLFTVVKLIFFFFLLKAKTAHKLAK